VAEGVRGGEAGAVIASALTAVAGVDSLGLAAPLLIGKARPMARQRGKAQGVIDLCIKKWLWFQF
jgi:hypothetical protein